MEDFYYAGGLPAVIRELESVLDRGTMTANGKTLWDNCKDAPNWNREVIRAFDASRSRKPPASLSCAATCALTAR
jgi:L-arabonate dehydrase